MAAYTPADLQGQVNLLMAAVQAAAKREAILLAALREYADADNWQYADQCGIGPNVARAALDEVIRPAVLS